MSVFVTKNLLFISIYVFIKLTGFYLLFSIFLCQFLCKMNLYFNAKALSFHYRKMSEPIPTTTDADCLYGTSLTLAWIETKLQNSFNTKSKFGENVKTERIAFGQGFLSVMVHVIADWTPKDEKLPSSFIVKIPSGQSMRQSADNPEMREKMKKINADAGTEIDMDAMLNEFDKLIHMVGEKK